MKAPGYPERRFEAEILPGQTTTLDVDFSPEMRWEVIEGRSRMDDASDVVFGLAAVTPVARPSAKNYYPYLFIRCHNNKTEFIVITGSIISTTQVRIRLDASPAQNVQAAASVSFDALFLQPQQPIALLRQMVKHQTLLVNYGYVIPSNPFAQSAAACHTT